MIPVFTGIGEILWDLLPTGKQLGGAPANFACHAGRLGADAFAVSCIGKDKAGSDILTYLEKLFLSSQYIEINDSYPTGSVSVSLDEQGIPEYTIHEGTAWDNISFSDRLAKLALATDVVCYGSLAQRSQQSRSSIQSFLKSCRPSALKVFDINLRQNFYSAEILHDSLLLADVLKINDEEFNVKEDEVIIVPAGAEHYVKNSGEKDLKLYTIYTPPEHPDGTVHETKADADAHEH